jgi:hypothetical protein
MELIEAFFLLVRVTFTLFSIGFVCLILALVATAVEDFRQIKNIEFEEEKK